MKQSKHNRSPLAQEIWELATAMNRIRASEAHYRLDADPHKPDQNRGDYFVCPRCAFGRVAMPLDTHPGACPVCDTDMIWE